jgi:ABC-type transport system involved in Fe-S cluster assembly fused permease/ATPase subunit
VCVCVCVCVFDGVGEIFLNRFVKTVLFLCRSINFVLDTMAFKVVPTILEIGLVCGILGSSFGPEFIGVTITTLVAYVAFTVGITNWRYYYSNYAKND